MKNWDWFELGPELAIETIPLALCFKESVISSLNFPPQIDFPPFPVFVGSPKI